MDSLLSIVQMPAGMPVGTLAIGRAGAVNAALLAAAIVALSDDGLRERLRAFRAHADANRARATRIPPGSAAVTRRRSSAAASSAACWRWPGRRSASRCADARSGAATRRRRRSAPAIVGAYDDPDAPRASSPPTSTS